MIDLKELRLQILTDEWDRSKGRTKESFWASDCLRPACDIYWKWTGMEETNPIQPESLMLMQVGKLYEQVVVDKLRNHVVGLDQDDRIEQLGLKLKGDQFRVEMEREYVPVTGYMDAVTLEGFPLEVKTHGSQGVDSLLEAGNPPNEHYCYQCAVYMDFLGVDKGFILSISRANGKMWLSEIVHLGHLVYECKGFTFDLGEEYKRWRKIMEDNIIPLKEPKLEYFYHPKMSNELLAKYPDDKIKKAIKGERVLSDHRWRYQYSSFKDLVIKKEAEMKGVDPESLCVYTQEETQFMMDYLNVEWKQTKRGMCLYKKKPAKQKT